MTLVTITRNKKDADATNIASLVDIIKVFFFFCCCCCLIRRDV